ncbi:alpha/beta hydrolase [Acinetobacter rudis]|uniref:Alpha/beta hydrolase n=1 Tax=Acinetobacter rudis TaxID=632955 RepID=A0AAW8J7N2_9GAMM|nr:alpha/beta hydrolase [Acinetobacter rudis]MDQ8935765.1 alpha/beta hydrolase [Acinetobacter rudis]MDQ9018034.1 alpha/beta hydrolase [Acinetobacter rudis]
MNNSSAYSQSPYQQDILAADYEQTTLSFAADEQGPVIATLVRKKASKQTSKAVLYIHGFLDYFFQTQMAEQFNQHGYDFYALDLHKYGRSYRTGQTFYDVRQLSEYDAEITAALEIIATEKHHHIVLAGHSTGGLITTLYAAHHPNHPFIKALWNNSPFYDFNTNIFKKKLALPRVSALGKRFPKLKFPSELNPWYTKSLHKDFYGEWDFNLNWKPTHYPKVYLSFIHAIYEAQKEIHMGAKLTIPALIMHSHQSKNPKRWGTEVQNSDVILSVKDIEKYANKLQGDVSVMTIKNGIHDLVLSAAPVRAEVYQNLFTWLKEKID